MEFTVALSLRLFGTAAFTLAGGAIAASGGAGPVTWVFLAGAAAQVGSAFMAMASAVKE